ncbi:DUF4123 domain-containing protein [Cobetia amphilecti]|uniref:DUF4123 domain-containing protein n=1 Tax=Cobetia amphilecti TaxID=1055104 RepID=UPI001C0916D1|nr:DUF4123 domain-containing protein [Cobetia amphilecti]
MSKHLQQVMALLKDKEYEKHQALENMIEWLDGQETGQLYCMVDPSDSPERALAKDKLKQCGILKHSFFSHPLERQLFLQPVKSDADSVRQMVIDERNLIPERRTEPFPFCGWIYSHYPLESLVEHLEEQRIIKRKHGKPSLFRYQDPRVLERLVDILSKAQLTNLMGPVEAWWFFDSNKKLSMISNFRTKGKSTRTILSVSQWDALKRVGMVNGFMEMWQNLTFQNKREISPAEVDSVVMVAYEKGIVAGEDVKLFVLHGILIPRFYQHPYMIQKLDSIEYGESYSSLAAIIDDHLWAKIQREMEISS